MTQFYILRSIGFVLICALVLNITVVLAAPFYWRAEQLAETPAMAEASVETKRVSVQADPTSTEPAPLTATIEAEIVADDSQFDDSQFDDSQFDDSQFDDSQFDDSQFDDSQFDDSQFDDSQFGDDPLESDEFDSDLATSQANEPFDFQGEQALTRVSESAQDALQRFGSNLGRHSSPIQRHLVSVAKHLASNSSANANDVEAKEGSTVDLEDDSTNSVDPQVDTLVETQENGFGLTPTVSRIVIVNPAENELAVSFVADGAIQTLTPGAEFIDTKAEVLVRFDRGGTFGAAEKKLSPGRYEFDVSRAGWTLDVAKTP